MFTAPVDGATNVNYVGANIAVTFTKSMDTATLTTNTTTACTGSIQVSSNGFVDCVPMTSATPVFFSGNALAIVTPAAPLAGNTTYRVRVLATARDTFNYPMAATYTSATGFLTIPDVTPPVAGAGITFSNVGNRHLTVSWGTGTDDSTQPGNLQYKLVKDNSSAANINTVALADAKSGADLIQDWTANLTTTIATGLSGTTNYHWAVLVRDLGGNKALYAPAMQATTTWQSAANMASGRLGHAATLLANGKVLVTGGWTAEIYDPLADTFSAAGPVGVVRFYHTATLLGNGKVLIAGGSGGEYSAELYDPVTNTFTTTAPLTVGRREHTATLLANGKVLVVGGVHMGYVSESEIYDPLTNTFTFGGSLATGRYAHTANLLTNGKVLVTGGQTTACNLSSAELYDPVADTFSSAGSMASPRCVHTATILGNGKVLVAGGWSGSTLLSSTDVYDPITNTFSAGGSMATGRQNHAAAPLANGKALIIGGSDWVGGLASAEIFNPLTGAFSPAGFMLNARREHTATLLANGQVLVTGGRIPTSSAYSSAELYE
ncbi:MAG: kelch repeat-containing protein [Turneriella sp.]